MKKKSLMLIIALIFSGTACATRGGNDDQILTLTQLPTRTPHPTFTPEPTPTEFIIPTDTPAPPTNTPEPEAEATDTPEPEPTDRPVPPQATINDKVNVRNGPGTNYSRIGLVETGV